MAVTFTKYTHTHKILTNQGDWNSNTIKLALVLDTYVFSAGHTVWADASSYEVATGNGYTTGGATVTCTASNTALSSSNVTWTTLTKTFRGAVLYINGTIESLTNPVLAYILFNDTPEDTVVTGVDFPVIWNASGVFTL
jgi:hypothetical protein